jgi:hypothetical protein
VDSSNVDRPDYRPDAEITLQIAGQHFTLHVEAKRELYPRDVREVLGVSDQKAALTMIPPSFG